MSWPVIRWSGTPPPPNPHPLVKPKLFGSKNNVGKYSECHNKLIAIKCNFPWNSKNLFNIFWLWRFHHSRRDKKQKCDSPGSRAPCSSLSFNALFHHKKTTSDSVLHCAWHPLMPPLIKCLGRLSPLFILDCHNHLCVSGREELDPLVPASRSPFYWGWVFFLVFLNAGPHCVAWRPRR